jgi:ABC-2 type transport system permease protein
MRFTSLAQRNLKEIFRDPITLLLGVAMPVLFLVLFSSLQNLGGGIELFQPQMLTPGLVIFSFAFIIMFSGTLLGKDSKTAFLTRLLSTPLRPIDYLLAYLLPFIPVAVFQVVVCYSVGLVLGITLTNVGLSLLIFFLMAILCISIGIILGSLFTLSQISGLGSLLITTISLFSGAWMDLKMIGGVFYKIGYALPFAYSIDALKALTKGAGFTEVRGSLLWVLGYTVILFFAAVYAIKWKTRRA